MGSGGFEADGVSAAADRGETGVSCAVCGLPVGVEGELAETRARAARAEAALAERTRERDGRGFELFQSRAALAEAVELLRAAKPYLRGGLAPRPYLPFDGQVWEAIDAFLAAQET